MYFDSVLYFGDVFWYIFTCDVLEALIRGDVHKTAISQFSDVNKMQIYSFWWCISSSYFILVMCLDL